MALETASYISQLTATNPTTSDSVAQGDDHIRMIKDCSEDPIQRSFWNNCR